MRYYGDVVLDVNTVAIPRTAVQKIQVRSNEMGTWLLTHTHTKVSSAIPMDTSESALVYQRIRKILRPVAYISEASSLSISGKGEEMLGNCAIS